MRCRVWSRVVPSSASKMGSVNIKRIRALLPDTMLDQSASLMARSELTALLTLRLSAAWSALCCA